MKVEEESEEEPPAPGKGEQVSGEEERDDTDDFLSYLAYLAEKAK
jgi:hypothetical protein